ncbi:MAG: UDP-N-acetylmuramate--L-alanine ligase, partial [Armatimonadota bacterium]|nr:UDP-N-acetylmuramate--L-alanine ligase [Armatimonadota bacterium]
PIPGISSARLAEEVRQRYPHLPIVLAETPEQAAAALTRIVKAGDVVLTLGAGELDRTARLLLRYLQEASHA